MKAIKYLLILMATLLGSTAQAQNILSVPDIVGAAGKTIAVPIQMTNQDEVVAVQFDVQLPFAKASGEPMLSTARNKNGHTVGVRSLGGNRYTVVIASLANKTLAGTSGTLVSIPMTVSSSAEYGDGNDYSIRLSNVVITNRRGDNIATGSTDGSFSVQRAPSPDLAVSEVRTTLDHLDPGKPLTLSWLVRNHGEADTRSGWSETISLVNALTDETFFVGNAYTNDILVAGGSIRRTTSCLIPQTVGVDGDVYLRVTLTPNSSTGELLVDRADNVATSEASLPLSKNLYFTLGADRLAEGSSTRVTLKRSGDRSMAETFTISNSLPGLVDVPASVTFPAGQAAVAFDVRCPQNDDVNAESVATITIPAAHGYAAVGGDLTIVDDELLPMQVTLDKSVYDEGDTMHATITVPKRIGDHELTVFFSIEEAKRFKLPLSLTFEPGATSATVDIPVVQDNKPANTVSVELTVTADQYQTARTLFQLNDDDVPAIDFTMTPTEVSEGDGPAAMFCSITRRGVTTNKVTIHELIHSVNADIGTYDVATLAPADGNFYVSSNALYHVDQTTATVGRYRAYFHTDSAASSVLRLGFGHDGTVGIADAIAEPLPPTAIYDAAGRRIGSVAEPLTPGIYVIGGRKCIVK